jgi:hypothetical protein
MRRDHKGVRSDTGATHHGGIYFDRSLWSRLVSTHHR